MRSRRKSFISNANVIMKLSSESVKSKERKKWCQRVVQRAYVKCWRRDEATQFIDLVQCLCVRFEGVEVGS